MTLERVMGFLSIGVVAGCASLDSGTPVTGQSAVLSDVTAHQVASMVTFKSSVAGPVVPAPVTCAVLPPVDNGICEYTPGNDALHIKGILLTSAGAFVGADVLVQDGKTTWFGCGDTPPPAASGAAVLTCPAGAISPGLINSHDHLGYNQQPPRLPCQEDPDSNDYRNCTVNPPGFDPASFRYSHRNQWRPKAPPPQSSEQPWLVGQTAPATSAGDRFFVHYDEVSKKEQVQWAELRHALAGTTSIVGSYIKEDKFWPQGMLRNLDVEDLQEGLDVGLFNYDVFPQGDLNGVFEPNCQYTGTRKVGPSALDATAFVPHVAEGVDYFAQTEIKCVTGFVGDSGPAAKAFIHTVAATAEDGEYLANQNISVVWAPRSNTSLYGNTAPIPMYDAQSQAVSLSTDWTPSGSINLLDEMVCVNRWNEVYFNNYFSDYSIWMMTTFNPSLALNVYPKIGVWMEGGEADIAIFDASDVGDQYYQAVTRARLEDVALVMRGGQVLTGNTDVVSAMPGSSGNCESIGNVCGTDKSACIAGQYHTTWAALVEANSDSYMLFDQQCRAPEAYAPSCLPARQNAPVGGSYTGVVSITDSDGDGVANNIDNCPTTFNPIRPMDVNPMTNQGAQLDCDQDGVGDACDATPMGGLAQCLGPYPPFARAP